MEAESSAVVASPVSIALACLTFLSILFKLVAYAYPH